MSPGPLVPSLAVLNGLSRALDEALVAPFPRRAPGLGEGLLVSVLFGVDLVVEELIRQFISIIDLQLRRQRNAFKCFQLVLKPSSTYSFTCLLYLLGNFQMVDPLHLLQESTFAAGIEHPLFNVAAVPRHGVNEH